MSVTRFSKLKGFPDLIVGRDLNKLFKEGHVYSVEDILGVLMIKDLGEYKMPEDKREHSDYVSIIQDGSYLLVKPKP